MNAIDAKAVLLSGIVSWSQNEKITAESGEHLNDDGASRLEQASNGGERTFQIIEPIAARILHAYYF